MLHGVDTIKIEFCRRDIVTGLEALLSQNNDRVLRALVTAINNCADAVLVCDALRDNNFAPRIISLLRHSLGDVQYHACSILSKCSTLRTSRLVSSRLVFSFHSLMSIMTIGSFAVEMFDVGVPALLALVQQKLALQNELLVTPRGSGDQFSIDTILEVALLTLSRLAFHAEREGAQHIAVDNDLDLLLACLNAQNERVREVASSLFRNYCAERTYKSSSSSPSCCSCRWRFFCCTEYGQLTPSLTHVRASTMTNEQRTFRPSLHRTLNCSNNHSNARVSRP